MGLNARDLMIAHSHLAHRGLLASSLFVRIRLILLEIFKDLWHKHFLERIWGCTMEWCSMGLNTMDIMLA